jgi:hypothetical protein
VPNLGESITSEEGEEETEDESSSQVSPITIMEEIEKFRDMPLLKCPYCDFRNVYQESIDHHIK